MSGSESIANTINQLYAKVRTTIQGNRKGKLSEPLAYELAQLITAGTLSAGYKFPNENEFCAMLGVGRGTLREAYMILHAQGLVIRSQSGTRVASPDNVVNFSPVSVLVMETHFDELQEYRVMLEQETARLAAKRATPEDIARLKQVMTDMELCRDDIEALTRHDTCFHMLIAEASKNKMMQSALGSTERLIAEMDISVYNAFTHNDNWAGLAPTSTLAWANIVNRAIYFHHELLEAIIQHNSVAARVIMADHMKDVSNTLTAYAAERLSQKERMEPDTTYEDGKQE